MGWQYTDDNVIIYLEDTGIGIPKEKQELIFDRYYKESSSTAGAGIGLSLCRRLVENMHGKIQVESTKDRTTFVIMLPVQQNKKDL